MSLKTFVKVGKITNLSDARYCAGMGVDMLGFRVIQGDVDYLSPERFKELRGWFTGPTVVAEAYGIKSSDEVIGIIQNYQPDFIEISVADLKNINSTTLPIILSGTPNELDGIKSYSDLPNIEYVLFTQVPSKETLAQFHASYKILIAISEESDLEILDANETLVTGISLHGSPEEKPGLKNYDVLADVLEKLEKLD
jgi:phosphoribosylanthranilate isomerase